MFYVLRWLSKSCALSGSYEMKPHVLKHFSVVVCNLFFFSTRKGYKGVQYRYAPNVQKLKNKHLKYIIYQFAIVWMRKKKLQITQSRINTSKTTFDVSKLISTTDI